VLVLAFSPDGHRIVSGSIDFTARTWDATPFAPEVLQAQQARYQQKTNELRELTGARADALGGERLARNGQWDLAAAALDKAITQELDNLELRRQHILSLVEAGDLAGVRRACEDLLNRFRKTAAPDTALAVAWSCVLTPDAVADREALVRLAEATREWSDEGRSQVFGAVLYRSGRFEEAIRSLEKGIRLRGGTSLPRDWVFLALAHHRLGRRDEAKRWLDKLAAYRPKQERDSFWDEVEIRILRREVVAVLGNRYVCCPPARSPSSRGRSGQLDRHRNARPDRARSNAFGQCGPRSLPSPN
jgi:tetratricopeptide (TPR) repeat protein